MLYVYPFSGQYDWLSIQSSDVEVVVGNSLTISAEFLHLPHNGISLWIDHQSVSADADMHCTSLNGVMSKVVHFTCITMNSNIKTIEAHLSFCNIEFFSEPLMITINERPGKAII